MVFFKVILFLGLMLLPTLGFSQQEQPKRVAVVVTAKEIVAEKEIVQLPADNMPIVTAPSNTMHNSKAAPAKKQASLSPATISKKPVVKALPTTKTYLSKSVVTTFSKTSAKAQSVTKQKIKDETLHINTVSSVGPSPTDTTMAKPNQISNQLNNKDSSIAVSESIQRQNTTVTNTTKASSFSYIWIGSFLVIAGLVLGLLFGKPAFLISFVGVVFVVLGILI